MRLKTFLDMAATPEIGQGWGWLALWGGHVFVGFWLAVCVAFMSDLPAIVIDPVVFFGYFLFKEMPFDLRRGGTLRDSLTDCMAVGFGSYATTALIDGNLCAAFWTLNLAVVVGIYGLAFNLERDDK